MHNNLIRVTDHSDCFRLKDSVNTQDNKVRVVDKHVEDRDCRDADGY